MEGNAGSDRVVSPGAGRSARLGRYEIVRRVAVGGMAEVFVARTTALGGFEKYVALKRILEPHARNRRFVEMLLDEARLAATLHHPNVVQVYDVGRDASTYFYTMEYVHGRDLRQLLQAVARRESWVPREHAINIIIGAAAGLHYAHEKRGHDERSLNIVHCDVSPSNLLVSFDGCTKLVDFGIAKAATTDIQAEPGRLRGKLSYMSPEQCRGETLDRRSDIFSLGILLWELLTGQRLFRGGPDLELLKRIAYEQAPSPATAQPDFPRELERIVNRALKLEPEFRYQSAQELQIDLEEYAREQRMAVSAVNLAAYMDEVFPPEDREPIASDVSATIDGTPLPGSFDIELLTRHAGDGALLEMFGEAGARRDDTPATPTWRSRPAIAVAAGVGVLAIGALAYSLSGGEESPTPAPTPTVVRVVDESPTPAAEEEEEDESRTIAVPVPAEPEPEPAPRVRKSSAKTVDKSSTRTQRKQRRKRKSKLPSDWDPNSALPPS
ncbi:MAG: serine/threonine protein kinase [Myxococcales bacterium]|nr:serine/threonine protein kinase [Myxococcales bacterium]